MNQYLRGAVAAVFCAVATVSLQGCGAEADDKKEEDDDASGGTVARTGCGVSGSGTSKRDSSSTRVCTEDRYCIVAIEADSKPATLVDPYFAATLALFESEAKSHGIELAPHFDTLVITKRERPEWAMPKTDADGKIIGLVVGAVCETFHHGGEVWREVSFFPYEDGSWVEGVALTRTLFHELGHCIFERGHGLLERAPPPLPIMAPVGGRVLGDQDQDVWQRAVDQFFSREYLDALPMLGTQE